MGEPIAVLISTYELGRQPFGLASPAAWLRRAGWHVHCLDLSKDRLHEQAIESASLIGFHLPMHTATRLAGPVVLRVRRLNPSTRICAYGLYGPLNEGWLRSIGVDDVLGGEFEEDLTAIARAVERNLRGDGLQPDFSHEPSGAHAGARRKIPRIHFLIPDRRGLPPLSRYASLHMPDGTRRLVGSTEASRGCKHLCRHCPVVPIYEGQFRIVQPDVVLADIGSQVAAGAEHVTFGDPDFFNGPTHAMRVVKAVHTAFPALSYDVTIKIEHLLKYQHLLPALKDTGCLFITSAVESVDDKTLDLLQKGHTRRDFVQAVAHCRANGLILVPTFVAFHPWLTRAGYCDLLDTIERLDLVDHVAPIQLAIRLLLPEGSKLLELHEVRDHVAGFDRATLTYRWVHSDRRVDDLQREVSELVGVGMTSDRRAMFEQISELAHERAGIGRSVPASDVITQRAAVPYLSEPWYCCAEPNPDQVRLV